MLKLELTLEIQLELKVYLESNPMLRAKVRAEDSDRVGVKVIELTSIVFFDGVDKTMLKTNGFL